MGSEWPVASPPYDDRKLAVIGAGTMGAGIAQCAISAGFQTQLFDINQAALDRGMQKIQRSLENAVNKGKLSIQEQAQRLAKLSSHTNWRDLQNCDVVIEAVFENLSIKQQVMAQLHQTCPEHTLLISNTSTLDIDAMASASRRPDQVLGMHFLTPAHITPLVEVIKGKATSDTSISRAHQLATRLGKLPILTGNAWGFIGNRMFEGYLREVDALQLEGVSADRIDKALEAFGFALGPCKTLDMAGTDLVSQVLTARGLQFEQPPEYRRITQRLAELGRLGHKTQRGHYIYKNNTATIDPDLQQVCAQEAERFGIAQQPNVTDKDIVQRCVQPLMDEGHLLLQQGLAQRASDIDLIWVLGYGFPAKRGGPMYMSGESSVLHQLT
jgi:3-hydroxyacyl-CoA dehydrogenase